MKAIILAKEEKQKEFKICGLSLIERALYLLRTVGIREIIIFKKSSFKKKRRIEKKLGIKLEVVKDNKSLSSLIEATKPDGSFLIINENFLFDNNLLEVLLKYKGTVLCGHTYLKKISSFPRIYFKDGNVQEIGENLDSYQGIYEGIALCEKRILLSLLKDDLALGLSWPIGLNSVLKKEKVNYLNLSELKSYNSELRREIKPFWQYVKSEKDLKTAKKYLIKGVQKRTLDVFAWYIHRPIENKITWWLCESPLTPNQLTLITFILALFVTLLFFKGYLLLASLLTLAVNILDGLDGKQARAKGMFTKVGNLEHSLDTLYEQSWYIAFSYALFTSSGKLLPLQLCLVMILFDAFSRHCSMQFRMTMGVPLADYSLFDRMFRKFDGRRNVYTFYILVGVLAGVPLYSLIAMSIHAVLTGIVYFVRAAGHMHKFDKGKTLKN